jgi:hypothetical protein
MKSGVVQTQKIDNVYFFLFITHMLSTTKKMQRNRYTRVQKYIIKNRLQKLRIKQIIYRKLVSKKGWIVRPELIFMCSE